ncbi:MAG: hypothetical protein R3A13_08920, partial [Bdellovibrionota bacterium]
DQRYTAIAEAKLKQKYPQQKIEILNFGISGGPTVGEAMILGRYIDRVDPDLIVVGFCFNDPQPKSQDYSQEAEDFKQGYQTLLEFKSVLSSVALNKISELYTKAVFSLAVHFDYFPSWDKALARVYNKNSEDWKNFEAALKKIKQISDYKNLPPPIFASLNQGSSNSAPTDYVNPDPLLRQLLAWSDQAVTSAKKFGFYAYDHKQEIAQQINNTYMAINREDGHPSASLNVIYGEKLAEVIEEYIKKGLV